MPTIPYIKRIAAAALGNIDSVLNRWLPGGKCEGREYKPRNPKRADNEPGSFSINLDTGAWTDFATGDKGLDLVALIAYLESENQGKAAKRLAAFLGIPPEQKNSLKRAMSDSKKPCNGKPSTIKKESSGTANPGESGNDGDGWKCICLFPIMYRSHRLHTQSTGSRQSGIRTLHKMACVNFYHDPGYDKPRGEKKQFSPVTLWQKGNKYEWRFKVP